MCGHNYLHIHIFQFQVKPTDTGTFCCQFWKQDKEDSGTRIGNMANEGFISGLVIPFIKAVGSIGLAMSAVVIIGKILGRVSEGIHRLTEEIPSSIRTTGMAVTILGLVFLFFIVVQMVRSGERLFSAEVRQLSGLIFAILVMVMFAQIMWNVGIISVEIPISFKTTGLVAIILIVIFVLLIMNTISDYFERNFSGWPDILKIPIAIYCLLPLIFFGIIVIIILIILFIFMYIYS